MAIEFLTVILMSFNAPASDTLMVGKIINQPYIDKRGRPAKDIYDLFFETSSDKYFIKLSESNVSKDALLSLVNQSVKCRASLRKGTWDSDVGASRIGNYIIIHELLSS